MTKKYPGLTFESTSSELVIFSPEVMGLTGETRLTWRLEIGDSENTARERLLVDAHNGEIAYHCFLICSALDLSVVDMQYTSPGPPDEIRDDDSDDPDDYHSEVNRAWDYCSETYRFYLTQHSRDGWNGQGGFTKVYVRSSADGPYWSSGDMYLPIGTITDDTVGHEFTHGVLKTDVGLDGYGANESGAVMEALCDCWGEWIDQTTNHDDSYDDIDDSPLTWFRRLSIWIIHGRTVRMSKRPVRQWELFPPANWMIGLWRATGSWMRALESRRRTRLEVTMEL